MKHCPDCGEELSEKVKFCPDCGHSVRESSHKKISIDKVETKIVKGGGFFSKLSDTMGISAGLIMGCCLAVGFIILIIIIIAAK